MRIQVAVGAAIIAAGLGGFLYAQETRPVPGFGTGVVKIEGTVEIGNAPVVLAHQSGEWKMTLVSPADVRIVNAPPVTLAAPAFLKKDARYEVVWATGDRQTIRVAEVGTGGWIRVDATDGEQWLNLASARAVGPAK